MKKIKELEGRSFLVKEASEHGILLEDVTNGQGPYAPTFVYVEGTGQAEAFGGTLVVRVLEPKDLQ